MSTVVFLGGGRITSAMLAGLRLSRTNDRLLVHDRNPAKLRRLMKSYGVAIEPNLQRAVAEADLLIVAVRPDSVRELLQALGKVKRPLVAISLAAGVPLQKLKAAFGVPVRWSRAMPSPACRSGRGLTALTFSREVLPRDRKRVWEFFSRFGQALEIPERKFDAFTVTYSSSHGYHALAALAGAAQKLGLDQKTALTAAAHALADGIVSWREGNISLDYLLREAATPGGIAATVMAIMEERGYPGIVELGLRAGIKRAGANAK